MAALAVSPDWPGCFSYFFFIIVSLHIRPELARRKEPAQKPALRRREKNAAAALYKALSLSPLLSLIAFMRAMREMKIAFAARKQGQGFGIKMGESRRGGQ